MKNDDFWKGLVAGLVFSQIVLRIAIEMPSFL